MTFEPPPLSTKEVGQHLYRDKARNNYISPVIERDRLCDLVVRVPGYTTEMYCAACEVRTEFIYVM
jgi:hypothetical protein